LCRKGKEEKRKLRIEGKKNRKGKRRTSSSERGGKRESYNELKGKRKIEGFRYERGEKTFWHCGEGKKRKKGKWHLHPSIREGNTNPDPTGGERKKEGKKSNSLLKKKKKEKRKWTPIGSRGKTNRVRERERKKKKKEKGTWFHLHVRKKKKEEPVILTPEKGKTGRTLGGKRKREGEKGEGNAGDVPLSGRGGKERRRKKKKVRPTAGKGPERVWRKGKKRRGGGRRTLITYRKGKGREKTRNAKKAHQKKKWGGGSKLSLRKGTVLAGKKKRLGKKGKRGYLFTVFGFWE